MVVYHAVPSYLATNKKRARQFQTAWNRYVSPAGVTYSQFKEELNNGNIREVTFLDIASSNIRKRAREGKTINYLVPAAVRHYIAKNALYRNL